MIGYSWFPDVECVPCRLGGDHVLRTTLLRGTIPTGRGRGPFQFGKEGAVARTDTRFRMLMGACACALFSLVAAGVLAQGGPPAPDATPELSELSQNQ